MGKKKKVTTKTPSIKNVTEIEFTTEIPIEVLCVACEFLPLKVLLSSIMRVSKEAKIFVENTIKKRRELNLNDYLNPYLRFEYDFGKREYKSHKLIDKRNGRFVVEYYYKDKQVIAVVDPLTSGESHIFEYKAKLDIGNTISYLTLTEMNIFNQIILFSNKFIDIYNIEESKKLHSIRLLKSNITSSNQEFSHSNSRDLTNILVSNDGLICLKLISYAILYKYNHNSQLVYLESIEDFNIQNIRHLTDDYYVIILNTFLLIYNIKTKESIIIQKYYSNDLFCFRIDQDHFLIHQYYISHIVKYKDDKWSFVSEISGVYNIFKYGNEILLKLNTSSFPISIKKDEYENMTFQKKEDLKIQENSFQKFYENNDIIYLQKNIGIYIQGRKELILKKPLEDVQILYDYQFFGYDKQTKSFKIFKILTK